MIQKNITYKKRIVKLYYEKHYNNTSTESVKETSYYFLGILIYRIKEAL